MSRLLLVDRAWTVITELRAPLDGVMPDAIVFQDHVFTRMASDTYRRATVWKAPAEAEVDIVDLPRSRSDGAIDVVV